MNDRALTHRVLLPLDGSELAVASIPYARALLAPESELILLRVVSDPTPMTELAGTSAFPIAKVRTQRLQEARAYLDAVIDTVREAVPTIRALTVIGSAPDEILRTAEREAVGMILMASHGRGAVGRFAMGSVADRVARAALMPVMVIHPKPGDLSPTADARAEIRRVVVPLDGSNFARQALPIAASIARQQGVPMHLVRATPSVSDLLMYPEAMGTDSGQMTEEYDKALWDDAVAGLDAEVAKHRAAGISTGMSVVVGSAARSILEVVEEGDLIVMTSHGEGGVRRWLLGSVAEKLIHAGAAPVILVPTTARRLVITEVVRRTKGVEQTAVAAAMTVGTS